MDTIDLDSMAQEIARKRLLQNKSFRELGKTYYASPSTIHRRINKWLSEGRFELIDTHFNRQVAAIVARDEALAAELVRKTGIWRSRVIQITGVEPAYTDNYLHTRESERAQAAYRASDDLHRCLGEAAAEVVLNSLRRNMTIGISSGRGVGFTVEKLAELVQKSPSWAGGYESVRLVSLCGGVHVGKWGPSGTDSRDYDADENVFAFASVLKIARHNLSYVTGPISINPGEQPLDVDTRYNLDMAIIGLGQLNTQHHYFRDISGVQLRRMSGPIRDLIEWHRKEPGLFEGMAEIVLKLYPQKQALPAEFLEIVRQANNSILSVDPARIKNAGEVIMIAGGKQKLDALYGVLAGRYPDIPVDKKNLTLVTDAWTAAAILQKISGKISWIKNNAKNM